MNRASELSALGALPDPIVAKLRLFIRRIRRVIFTRGLCATGAAAIGAFLAAMAVDAGVTLFAAWPRWGLALGAYGVTVAATLWFLVRPLARSYTLAGAARLIEAHHPELQERISSSVELLTSRDLPALRGSDVLIRALTEEAVRDVGFVQPRREVSLRSALPYAVAVGALGVVLAGLLLLKPRQTTFLLARTAAPFLNLPNVHAADVAVEPGDLFAAEGSRVQIVARVRNDVVSAARLRRVESDGRERTEPMTAVAVTNGTERRFVFVLPAVDRGFRYRVHAGDALTRYFTVTVAKPPVVQRLALRTEYPVYSGLGVREEEDPRDVRALSGSSLRFTVTVSKPVTSAVLRVVGTGATNEVAGSRREGVKEGVLYDFGLDLTPPLTGLWSLRLTDEIGLTNRAIVHSLQVIRDHPPLVRVRNLDRREIRLNRDDRVPVLFLAEDDFGVQRVALTLEVDGRKEDDRVLMAPPVAGGRGERRVEGSAELDTAEPVFRAASRITFRLTAADVLPEDRHGPQAGASETYTIVIDQGVASWREQVLVSQEKRLKQGLEQARRDLTEARDGNRAARGPLEKEPKLGRDAAAQLDRVQKKLDAAETGLRDLSRELADGYFERLATQLDAIAEQHVGRAASLASQVKVADNREQRAELNRQAGTEIEASLTALEQAAQATAPVMAALRRAVELENLAAKQNRLAEVRSQMDAVDEPPTGGLEVAAEALPQPAEWQKAQSQVADNLGRLARETPGAAAEVARLNAETAAEARDELVRLAADQSNVMARVAGQVAQLETFDQALRGLAEEQGKLADRAALTPLTPDAARAMRRATDDIRGDQLAKAQDRQQQAESALRDHAAALLEARQSAAEPVEEPAAQRAQEASRRAEEAVRQAGAAREEAAQATVRSREQQARVEAMAAVAEKSGSRELAQEFRSLAEESKANSEQAGRWEQAAAQASEAARQAGETARQASDQVAREPLPEAARSAAGKAEQAADEAERQARRAEAMAAHASAAAEPADTARDRAGQAASDAAASAREARAAAVQAEESGRKADEHAVQAVARAEEASKSGDLARARQTTEAAGQVARRAREAGKAAEAARGAAEDASRGAEKADQAAREVRSQPTPKAEARKAEEAEQAARQAEEGARKAIEQARQAGQLAEDASGQPPREQAQRAAQAAQASARAAAEAAAEADRLSGESRREAEKAQQAAQAAEKSGDRALAAEAALQATRAQVEARESVAGARKTRNAAQKAAEAAAQSGKAAERSARSPRPSEADRLAREAQEGAERAAQRADEAREALAAMPRPGQAPSDQLAAEKTRAARAASQSAETAEGAARLADQAARAADQAAGSAEKLAGQAGERAARQQAADGAEQGKADAASAQASAQAARRAAASAREAAQGAAAAGQKARQAAQQAAGAQDAQQAEGARWAADQSAQEAVSEARQAAAAAQTARQAEAAAGAPGEVPRLEKLATDQADVRAKTAQLAAQQATTAAELRRDMLPLLAERQRELATQVAELASELAVGRPAEQARAAEAARHAEAASDALAAGAMAEARPQAAAASQGLESMAKDLRKAALQSAAARQAPQGDLARVAGRASTLAQEQDRLEDQMEALAGDRPVAQLAAAQSALAARTADLAADVAALNAQAPEAGLPGQAAQTSAQAAQQAAQGAQQASQAAERLESASDQPQAGGQLASSSRAAQASQQAAVQAMGQAAQSMGQTATSLAQAAASASAPAAGQPGAAPASPGGAVPEAYQAARQAAQSQGASDAVKAAQATSQAASQAAAQARAMGGNPSVASPQASPSDGRSGSDPDLMVAGQSPTWAWKLREKLRDWFRLPGELSDDVLQAGAAEGPEEYRPIIKQYFEEVARRGGRE